MNIFSTFLLVMTVVGPRPYVLPHAATIDAPVAKECGIEVEVTSDTKIYLDGKPCRMKGVPRSAEIELLDVGKDGKTAVRIHFRSANKVKKTP